MASRFADINSVQQFLGTSKMKIQERKTDSTNVRAKNVPTHIFFFKLATLKGNDLLLSKRQKK